MKKSITTSKIISIILILLLLITTKVYGANDNYSVTLNANAKAERKSEIVVVVGIDNVSVESGEKGIGAYTGKIKYDPNVLEYKETAGSAKWEAPLFQNGLIIGNTKNGEVEKEKQSIGSITFNVKENAPLGDTTIQVVSFSGSTGVNDISSTNNQSIKVNIVAAPGEEDPDKNDPDKNDPDKNDPDKNDPDKNDPDKNDPDKNDPDKNDPDKNDPDKNDPDKNDPDKNDPDKNDPNKGDSNQSSNPNKGTPNSGGTQIQDNNKPGGLPKLGANNTIMYIILIVSIIALSGMIVLLERKSNKK